MFLVFLKVFNFNGIEILFDILIELNGKLSFCVSFIKIMFYVGCVFLVYKLKIVKKNVSVYDLMCMIEFKVKEDFDVFFVDEE